MCVCWGGGRRALFPSLQYLQPWQCVSDVCDVKRTTVHALWWSIVYWSGSLCLCERFDIHATFTPRRWEGKLLFLAHLLLALCVFIPAHAHTHTHTSRHTLGSGGAHVTQLSYYVEGLFIKLFIHYKAYLYRPLDYRLALHTPHMHTHIFRSNSVHSLRLVCTCHYFYSVYVCGRNALP